ncbi:sulfite oxidase subunit YedZ [Altererythrobacter sp. SALINAS58]|uniref:sulfite oxidase heme-binding subunit YedZ n=1 Tax=Alteripontixanthobacter muriae TaxID=2705546 RepID=UPI001575E142|nr:ferric reductase-like transmembrane domain-containing protein [Alteripontixanthobacter muriae]NTZ43182.1 sulfite oxidase subunit YedZ [Alteripontixanthobacter muriae]
MKTSPNSRLVLWLILALPGILILGRWAFTPDLYGYGHAVGESGKWSAWLLMATLSVTPIRLVFRKRCWAAWLAKRRRDLGVASFAYACGHTIIYLYRKSDFAILLDELSSPYILAGWLSFALFVPLAVTSNDGSMRALKRAWKTLHRLVYPAAILMFLHWALLSFEPTTAFIHIGIMTAIELPRILIQWRQRVT